MIEVRVLKAFVLATDGGMIVGNAGADVLVPVGEVKSLVRRGKIEMPDLPVLEIAPDTDNDPPAAASPVADSKPKPKGRPKKPAAASPVDAPAE